MCDYIGSYSEKKHTRVCCVEGQFYDLGPKGSPEENKPVNRTAVPCPYCNHEKWLGLFKESFMGDGYNDNQQGKKYKRIDPFILNEQPGDNDLVNEWYLKGYNLFLERRPRIINKEENQTNSIK